MQSIAVYHRLEATSMSPMKIKNILVFREVCNCILIMIYNIAIGRFQWCENRFPVISRNFNSLIAILPNVSSKIPWFRVRAGIRMLLTVRVRLRLRFVGVMNGY